MTFLVRLLPLITGKFLSSDYLKHLLLVCIIHLTFTRSGLVELINFSYFWITCVESLVGSFFHLSLYPPQYWVRGWAEGTNDGVGISGSKQFRSHIVLGICNNISVGSLLHRAVTLRLQCASESPGGLVKLVGLRLRGFNSAGLECGLKICSVLCFPCTISFNSHTALRNGYYFNPNFISTGGWITGGGHLDGSTGSHLALPIPSFHGGECVCVPRMARLFFFIRRV